MPGKNLRPVGGVSLIGRAVRAGRMSQRVSAVYVSTDDAAIAAEARLHGARIIARPDEISGDGASSESGWLHGLGEIRKDYPELSRLVMLQCTSPFIMGPDIDGCLEVMEVQGTDCALSVLEDHSFLWTVDAAGRGVGLNHDETKQRQRRQDLPPQYCESGAIYCVDVAAFEKTGQRFCGTVAIYPVDHPPIEIDTLQDFAVCSQIAQASGRANVEGQKLQRIRAIVTGFEGVHTDSLVSIDQNGAASVRTSHRDGVGLSQLHQTGRWRMMILSDASSPMAVARGQELALEVAQGGADKIAALDSWLTACGLGWDELLYVGTDVPELAILQKAGVSACPVDAHSSILGMVDWILPLPGGQGALRSLSDTLMQQVT